MPVDFISFSPNYNPIVQGHLGTEEINTAQSHTAWKRWSEDLNQAGWAQRLLILEAVDKVGMDSKHGR